MPEVTRKPVENLERKIAARGTHHATALKTLSIEDKSFKDNLRAELAAGVAKTKAVERVAEAKAELTAAEKSNDALPVPVTTFMDLLDARAKSIADRAGAIPSANE